ncbi:hypothetical protein V5O48_013441 [Marasmius crinis-equi]|uniref:Uncharacterized protein n=1 Tax=Marasmius crinis-equi TaxID=585013 RepID=A0ABR3F027_9AGAR
MRLKIQDFLNSDSSQKTSNSCGISSEISVDNLIFDSLHRSLFGHPDPFESPLTTPPSSPQPSRPTSPFDLVSTTPLPSALQSVPNPIVVEKVPSASNQLARKQKQADDHPQSRHKNATDIAKSRKRAHGNRARKRAKNKPDVLSTTPRPRMKYLESSEQAENEGMNRDPVIVAGMKGRIPEDRDYALDELCGEGSYRFKLIKNKPGITQYVSSKQTSKIMAVSVPSPINDPTWDLMVEDAAQFCQDWRNKCRFTDKQGRRGTFDTINAGISIGNGQKEPMTLDQGPQNLEVVKRICQHASFRRFAGWMTACFSCWAPLLFLYYLHITTALLQHHTGLSLPFENAIFAAFALNFGPRTICRPHCNQKNLSFGWCAITALGKFNYKKGGHLVLWELGVVIEFPPGEAAFITRIRNHAN